MAFVHLFECYSSPTFKGINMAILSIAPILTTNKSADRVTSTVNPVEQTKAGNTISLQTSSAGNGISQTNDRVVAPVVTTNDTRTAISTESTLKQAPVSFHDNTLAPTENDHSLSLVGVHPVTESGSVHL